MYRDAAGQAIISAQAAQLIAESANAPVYIMADSMLGTGAVGGSVASVAAFGQQAGEQAHRILSGIARTPSSLEIRTDGIPTLDWRALKRWGISENRLPVGSTVRFRPQSVWEQYKWIIIIVSALCLLEATLIDRLLRRAASTSAGATDWKSGCASNNWFQSCPAPSSILLRRK